jgi:hypothetical protein
VKHTSLRCREIAKRERHRVAEYGQDLRAGDDPVTLEQREGRSLIDEPRKLVRRQHPRACDCATAGSDRVSLLEHDDRVMHDRLYVTAPASERHRRPVAVDHGSTATAAIGRDELELETQDQTVIHAASVRAGECPTRRRLLLGMERSSDLSGRPCPMKHRLVPVSAVLLALGAVLSIVPTTRIVGVPLLVAGIVALMVVSAGGTAGPGA